MQAVLAIVDQIHLKALDASIRYKTSEADLIEILQQVDQHKVYLHKGHSSLFVYVIEELRLSESVAYNLIAVSRKAAEVPELQEGLRAGTITLSNARKIAPVLNAENQAEWLKKAEDMSHRQLEKEVARVRPEEATPEKVKYVSESRTLLQLGLSEKDMLELRRVQDLLSQARQRAVSLEDVVVAMTQDYLKRHDPIVKAKRHRVKKGALSEQAEQPTEPVKTPVALQASEREPIPAAVVHEVNHRDQGRCTFVNPQGKRCGQKRWIEIHHRIHVKDGGQNTVENLATVCKAHHGWIHSQQLSL